jgi:hypothetical protein
MRKVFGRLAALAAAGALTFVALPAGSASAGSNGQQLTICAPADATSAFVEGTNQRGDHTWLFKDDLIPGTCDYYANSTWNWWWKGVTIVYFPRGDRYVEGYRCDMPEDDRFSDVDRC